MAEKIKKEPPKLPANWIVKYSTSRDGKIYYHNMVTGTSTWKKPAPAVNSQEEKKETNASNTTAHSLQRRKRQASSVAPSTGQPASSASHESPKKKHKPSTSSPSKDYSHLTEAEQSIVLGYSPVKKTSSSQVSSSGKSSTEQEAVKEGTQLPSSTGEQNKPPQTVDAVANRTRSSTDTLKQNVQTHEENANKKTDNGLLPTIQNVKKYEIKTNKKTDTSAKRTENGLLQTPLMSIQTSCVALCAPYGNSSYSILPFGQVGLLPFGQVGLLPTPLMSIQGSSDTFNIPQRNSAAQIFQSGNKDYTSVLKNIKHSKPYERSHKIATVTQKDQKEKSSETSSKSTASSSDKFSSSIAQTGNAPHVSDNASKATMMYPASKSIKDSSTTKSQDTNNTTNSSSHSTTAGCVSLQPTLSVSAPSIKPADSLGKMGGNPLNITQQSSTSANHTSTLQATTESTAAFKQKSMSSTCLTSNMNFSSKEPHISIGVTIAQSKNISPLLRNVNSGKPTSSEATSNLISQPSVLINRSQDVFTKVTKDTSSSSTIDNVFPAGRSIFDESTEAERDIEDMEVDEEGIMLLSNLQDIRGKTKLLDKDGGTVTEMVTKAASSFSFVDNVDNKSKTQSIVIVVDTNVLIASLKFLRDVVNYNVPEYGHPILVLPWVVMQELDYLKGGKNNKTSLRAMEAIRFIHSQLTANNPGLVGQTPKEAREETDIPIECNDDRVLQCCLQFQTKYADSKVVLLTRDKNLINKALIMGIQAASNDTLWSCLKIDRPKFVNNQPNEKQESQFQGKTDEKVTPSTASKFIFTTAPVKSSKENEHNNKVISPAVKTENVPMTPDTATPSASSHPVFNFSTQPKKCAAEKVPDTHAKPGLDEGAVLTKFDVVWKLIFQIKTQIRDVIKQGKLSPTYPEAVQMLRTLKPLVKQLKDDYDRCLALSPVVISEHKAEFNTLSSSLNSFFTRTSVPTPDPSKTVSASDLMAHFTHSKNRPTLLTGLQQLSTFISEFEAISKQVLS